MFIAAALAFQFAQPTREFGTNLKRAENLWATVVEAYRDPKPQRIETIGLTARPEFPMSLVGSQTTVSLLTYFDPMNYKVEMLTLDLGTGEVTPTVNWMEQGVGATLTYRDGAPILYGSGPSEPSWTHSALHAQILHSRDSQRFLDWRVEPGGKTIHAYNRDTNQYRWLRLADNGSIVGEKSAWFESDLPSTATLEHRRLAAPRSALETRFHPPAETMEVRPRLYFSPAKRVSDSYRRVGPLRIMTTVEMEPTGRPGRKESYTVETVFFDRDNFKIVGEVPGTGLWAFWKENGRGRLWTHGQVSEVENGVEYASPFGVQCLMMHLLLVRNDGLTQYSATSPMLPATLRTTMLDPLDAQRPVLDVDAQGRIVEETSSRALQMRGNWGVRTVLKHAYDPTAPTLAETRFTLPTGR